jgi:hypothetical protein
VLLFYNDERKQIITIKLTQILFPNLLRFADFFVSDWILPRRCWLFGDSCELQLICLSSLFTGACPTDFWLKELFMNSDSRPLLIRDRKLVSSDISLSRVGVFSGGLEADECFSKNKIRSVPLLIMWCLFWYFHWCSTYIRHL